MDVRSRRVENPKSKIQKLTLVGMCPGQAEGMTPPPISWVTERGAVETVL